MLKLTDSKAFELFKKMKKVTCPNCKGENKNCPYCEGEGVMFKVSDKLMKEMKIL